MKLRRKEIQMRTVVLILISSMVLFMACRAFAQESEKFKPIATSKQLMEAMIIPASDVLFNVGVEPPKNDEEWTIVRNNALILAESGNLLMIGSRAQDKDVWIKYSRAMLDAAAAALKAAEAKNVDAISEAGDQILAACSGCHDRFLKGATDTQ